MTLKPEDRRVLILRHLDKTKEIVRTVEFLIANKELTLAVNRIYYGIFYTLTALALSHQFQTSNHNQLIGWFNKEFVKTGRVDVNLSKFIRKAFENRMEGDYNVIAKFEIIEVEQMFTEMKAAILEIQKLLD